MDRGDGPPVVAVPAVGADDHLVVVVLAPDAGDHLKISLALNAIPGPLDAPLRQEEL